jgi:hypothetical protein
MKSTEFFNRATQLPVYVDAVNLMCKNINSTEENTEALLDASKEAGLKVNQEKMKYMFMSHNQTAEQNHYILLCSSESFFFLSAI